MNLALILGLCLLSAGWLPPAFRGSFPKPRPSRLRRPRQAHPRARVAPPSQTQTPPSESAQPAQKPKSPAQAKPTPAHPRRKKTIPPCSNAPTPLNTTVGKPADDSTAGGSANAGSTNANATALKPCPPPKKVVRNGGSNEPKVQLTGGTAAEQASDKSSTEQLRAATEENLKKAAALQLTANQRDMVTQIKEFLAQSKAAVAAGDLEGAHNLALKAHLLSAELVKP